MKPKGAVCTRESLLQPFEADRAEQEDGVEQQETESQPAVQLPAVQMDTQDLRSDGGKEAHEEKSNKCFMFWCKDLSVIIKRGSKKALRL